MKNRNHAGEASENSCLTIDDLYRYVALPDGARIPDLELHLSNCPRCREELAEVIKVLHPEPQDASDTALAPSDAEIARTLTLIRDVARKEERQKRRPPWMRWVVAAAAAVVLLAAAASGLRYHQERSRSLEYFDQAKSNLERVYAAASPDELRLDLPFRSAVTSRAATDESPLNDAKKLFFQAIAVRSDMSEAYLGLAFISLNESRFAEARDHFQKVLDIRGNRMQALVGRGVAEYGEARQIKNPEGRQTLLNMALADFDSVLKEQPASVEARYNRIRVLCDMGRRQEALAEIETYLSQDPDSSWAAKLKNLRTQLR